ARDARLADAEPYRCYAAHHAFLVGRTVAHEPERWPELWDELAAHHGGLDWPELPSLLSGLAEGAAPSDAVRTSLFDAARAERPTLRQTALVALAVRADDDPVAREPLGQTARDPVDAVRADVAAALRARGS